VSIIRKLKADKLRGPKRVQFLPNDGANLACNIGYRRRKEKHHSRQPVYREEIQT
jgi:hypothetical protein